MSARLPIRVPVIPECEIFAEGKDDTEKIYTACNKNPGHHNLYSVTEFEKHLPDNLRTKDFVESIHHMINRTVKIFVKYTSTERPDVYPGTNNPYPYSTMRGKRRMGRCGTGFLLLDNVILERLGKCPCHSCRESAQPKMRYWAIQVYTAAHVIFDDSEAAYSTYECFYHSRDKSNVEYFYGTKVRTDADNDSAEVTCVTHDEALLVKLNVLDKVKKVKEVEGVEMGATGVDIGMEMGATGVDIGMEMGATKDFVHTKNEDCCDCDKNGGTNNVEKTSKDNTNSDEEKMTNDNTNNEEKASDDNTNNGEKMRDDNANNGEKTGNTNIEEKTCNDNTSNEENASNKNTNNEEQLSNENTNRKRKTDNVEKVDNGKTNDEEKMGNDHINIEKRTDNNGKVDNGGNTDNGKNNDIENINAEEKTDNGKVTDEIRNIDNEGNQDCGQRIDEAQNAIIDSQTEDIGGIENQQLTVQDVAKQLEWGKKKLAEIKTTMEKLRTFSPMVENVFDQNLVRQMFQVMNFNYSEPVETSGKNRLEKSDIYTTVIVSHPHGCSKKVSIGKVLGFRIVKDDEIIPGKPALFKSDTICHLPVSSDDSPEQSQPVCLSPELTFKPGQSFLLPGGVEYITPPDSEYLYDILFAVPKAFRSPTAKSVLDDIYNVAASSGIHWSRQFDIFRSFPCGTKFFLHGKEISFPSEAEFYCDQIFDDNINTGSKLSFMIYDTCTCPGSSGALIKINSGINLPLLYYTHQGALTSGVNISSIDIGNSWTVFGQNRREMSHSNPV